MLRYSIINLGFGLFAIIMAEVIGYTFTYCCRGKIRTLKKESKILFSLIFAIFGTICSLTLPQIRIIFGLNTVIVAAVYMAIYYLIIYFIIEITGKIKKKSLSR